MLDLTAHRQLVARSSGLRFQGRVVQVVGLSIEVEGLRLPLGEICHLYPERATAGASRITAEVVGFRDERLILMPFADTHGVRPGTAVYPSGRGFAVPVGEELLGRVIDGLARPIDGKGPLNTSRTARITDAPPSPLGRMPIRTPLATGVRALDGMLTCGRGQRLGIFAGSGVGKSTLLGMIARNCEADINVIGLIGERGREVQEFIDHDLGPEGLARSVVVVSTSDQPALQRHNAAWVFTALSSPEHLSAAAIVRDAMFAYQQARDLINIGAYVAGSNPQIDRALRMQPHIQRFLRQPAETATDLSETLARIYSIATEEVSDVAAA